MIKLVVRMNNKLVGSHQLDKDRIVMGRDPECEVPIDNLGVSRHHAEIVKEGSTYIVRDLGSSNGTFVGDRKIKVHNLNDGDRILIGKHTITFENLETLPHVDEVRTSPARTKGPEDLSERTMQMEGMEVEALQRHLRDRLAAYVQTRDGSGVLRNYPLRKAFYMIGTATACEFQIQGWGLGHKHAMIVRDELGFRLVGLTKKLPAVGDRAADDHRLKDGDVIQIGRYEFTFRVGNP